MKVLLVFACILVYANAVSFYEVVSDEWVTWKLFHGKNYSNPVEDKFRLKIFMENKAKIAKHNAAAHQGHSSYFLKMNTYGDLVSFTLILSCCSPHIIRRGLIFIQLCIPLLFVSASS